MGRTKKGEPRMIAAHMRFSRMQRDWLLKKSKDLSRLTGAEPTLASAVRYVVMAAMEAEQKEGAA